MFKRQRFKIVVKEPAKSRLQNDQCPSCGKLKVLWQRRTDWKCCSKECTIKFQNYCIIYDWVEIRKLILRRDRYRCTICGKRSRYLIADHIIPIAFGGDEFNPKNIQTLCEDCNRLKTRRDLSDIAGSRRS